MDDVRIAAADPPVALESLIPQLTSILRRHGFRPEAAGRGWAHWAREADEQIVVRAYAYNADGGGISVVMTGADMPAAVASDLKRLA